MTLEICHVGGQPKSIWCGAGWKVRCGRWWQSPL